MSWSLSKQAAPSNLVQAVKDDPNRPTDKVQQKQLDRIAAMVSKALVDEGVTSNVDFNMNGHASDGATTGLEAGCTGALYFSFPGT